LIPLEEKFDQNDVVANPTLKSSNIEIEPVNITRTKSSNIEIEPVNITRTSESKLVNISRLLSSDIKEQYVKILSKYTDVFS